MKVDYQKYSKQKNPIEMKRKQLEFTHKLALAKYEGREIIYIDQTTFSVWNHISKTWQSPASRISFIQPDNKFRNITIYGAICEQAGTFSYEKYDTTNVINFLDFLNVMKKDEIKKIATDTNNDT